MSNNRHLSLFSPTVFVEHGPFGPRVTAIDWTDSYQYTHDKETLLDLFDGDPRDEYGRAACDMIDQLVWNLGILRLMVRDVEVERGTR